MPTPFNYHHLYYFYTIAKEESVSKASGKLLISQPSLSAQLGQFENFLGIKLFDRVGRKLLITEDGKHVLHYAETIFNAGRELQDSLSDKSKKGVVRVQIGLSNSIPKTVVANFLNRLLKAEPRVHLTVHEDRIEDMVEELKLHSLDLVLSDVPAKTRLEDNIQNELIRETPVHFFAHKSIAVKYKKIPGDLHSAPFILPTAHSQIFHSVKDYFASQGITPNIVAEIQDVELVFRLVMSGVGIAPLSESTLETQDLNNLVLLGDKRQVFVMEKLYLITKKRAVSHPLQEKILDILREKT